MINVKLGLLSFRWLLLFLFPLGYITTYYYFEGFAPEYFLLTALSLVACCFVLSILNRPVVSVLPVWVILIVFWIAYYLKFYQIVQYPELIHLLPLLVTDAMVLPQVLISVYVTTTIAFVTFSLVAVATYIVKPTKVLTMNHLVKTPRFNQHLLLILAVFLFVFTSGVVYYFNIVQGGAVTLPFRLGGLIVYMRIITIPMLLLQVVWDGLQVRSKTQVLGGITLFVAYGLSDILLRASKSTLMMVTVALVLLLLISGQKVKAKYTILALILGAVSFLIFPLAHAFRFARHSGLGVFDAFTEVINQGAISVVNVHHSILMRLTGSDLLMALIGFNVQPLGLQILEVITGPRGFAGYLTIEIFGASPVLIDTFGLAPSLLGFFFVAHGNVGVIVGMMIYTLGIIFLWNKLTKSRLNARPVAGSLFILLVLLISIDGVLDRALFHILPVYLASLILCEWLVRLRLKRSAIGVHIAVKERRNSSPM